MSETKDKLQDIKNRYEIVGNSPLLNRSLEVAMRVAPTDMTVLILGESGVGKENISKVIHNLSKRKHNGFIAINCGALPEGTIDSELFGHEKGSFTSAHETRKGYFETVDGGTIFLDEIGELPLETQSRLLRVLESGEFFKVGSSKVQKTDVRVIAATNKDLLELTQKGKFREDLYYRLSTITIKIPSLRDRKEDIPYLFAKFASDVADRYRVPPVELTDAAMRRVQEFPWPGNIRQLKNFAEQISVLETNRELDAPVIERYLPDLPGQQLILTGSDSNSFGNYHDRELIYKFLFDIKREVSEVKTLLYESLRNNIAPQPQQSVNMAARLLAPVAQHAEVQNGFYPTPTHDIEHEEEVVYSEHEEPGNGLSLHSQEKEMIKKALQMHHGKRKVAAKDLGISERTLYRKIKEYNLEDL
jgi:DNA-binding NtrC family response regulator